MAEYGFSAINNQLSVVISNKYKVLVFSERSQFNIRSSKTDANGYGAATFAKVVRSQEAPQIFVRVVSASHPNLGLYITILGSPGAWTGFRVTSAARGGSTLQNYVVEFVVCKFTDSYNLQVYGSEVRGENNEPVYSSADKVVKFSRFTKVWTKLNGSGVDEYKSNMVIEGDDFVSISSFDRGVSWFMRGARYAGLTILDAGAPALIIFVTKDTSMGPWFWQGINNTNFSIPICKFPPSRYANT